MQLLLSFQKTLDDGQIFLIIGGFLLRRSERIPGCVHTKNFLRRQQRPVFPLIQHLLQPPHVGARKRGRRWGNGQWQGSGLWASKIDTGARTSLPKFGGSESRGKSNGALETAFSPAGAEKMMGLLEGGASFCAAADKTTAANAPANNGILKFARRKLIVRVIC